MAEIRGERDPIIDAIARALEKYEKSHPGAEATLYRQNNVSVRIRIIDPTFDGMTRGDRHEAVWAYFSDLPEEAQSDISTLLLLTPDETTRRFSNYEFENPIPSEL